jgi:hypothetical protein
MAAKVQSWQPASEPDVLAIITWDDEDDTVPHVCIALTRAGVPVADPAAEYARLLTEAK